MAVGGNAHLTYRRRAPRRPVNAPALRGTKADLGPDTKPRLAIAYMITDNIWGEIDLGLPYKHDLVGDGAIAGTGMRKTKVRFSTGQTQDVHLDPLAVSVSVGYAFKGFNF